MLFCIDVPGMDPGETAEDWLTWEKLMLPGVMGGLWSGIIAPCMLPDRGCTGIERGDGARITGLISSEADILLGVGDCIGESEFIRKWPPVPPKLLTEDGPMEGVMVGEPSGGDPMVLVGDCMDPIDDMDFIESFVS